MNTFRGRSWVFVVLLTVLAATSLLGIRGVNAQDGAAVNIVDFAFEPAAVEVPVGATVTWTNAGGAPHTATANDGAFNSGTLQPGGSFSHTFSAAGSFPYFCEIHPQMTGTVTVTDAAAPAAAPADDQAAATDDQAAVGAGDDAEAAAPETRQVPRTGIGAAFSGPSSGLALFAALAAAALGLAALAAYRRA